jgi:hypothetical protein
MLLEREHVMSLRKAALLAFGVAALALSAFDSAVAQTKKDSTWGEPVDLKPLMPLPVRPFLPPNSIITPGPASSGSYANGPLNDPTRDQATPGLRFTIPSR